MELHIVQERNARTIASKKEPLTGQEKHRSYTDDRKEIGATHRTREKEELRRWQDLNRSYI
jgi:hypothetical protein